MTLGLPPEIDVGDFLITPQRQVCRGNCEADCIWRMLQNAAM